MPSLIIGQIFFESILYILLTKIKIFQHD